MEKKEHKNKRILEPQTNKPSCKYIAESKGSSNIINNLAGDNMCDSLFLFFSIYCVCRMLGTERHLPTGNIC